MNLLLTDICVIYQIFVISDGLMVIKQHIPHISILIKSFVNTHHIRVLAEHCMTHLLHLHSTRRPQQFLIN